MSKTILFRTIQFCTSIIFFVYKQVQCQNQFSFQQIQFSISTQFSSFRPIDRTLSGATTSGQSWRGGDGNEGVLRFLQSSCITETSLSDCLMSYLGHSLKWGLPLCREVVGVFYNPCRLGNQSHPYKRTKVIWFNP